MSSWDFVYFHYLHRDSGIAPTRAFMPQAWENGLHKGQLADTRAFIRIYIFNHACPSNTRGTNGFSFWNSSTFNLILGIPVCPSCSLRHNFPCPRSESRYIYIYRHFHRIIAVGPLQPSVILSIAVESGPAIIQQLPYAFRYDECSHLPTTSRYLP